MEPTLVTALQPRDIETLDPAGNFSQMQGRRTFRQNFLPLFGALCATAGRLWHSLRPS
jgi:hypothetical protein